MKNTRSRFSLKFRLISFYHAFNGIASAFRQEHNLWIHTLAAITAIILGFVLRISSFEWMAMAIVIAGVFASELFNSAIESLVDLCSPDFDKRAGRIKDMAAAAVLITAVGALATGLIIFIPKLVARL
jgi:diacylglycerol kinase